MAPRIVVCGATGAQGGACIRALQQTGRFQVAALVRDPSSAKSRALEGNGVQLIKGDMEDLEGLKRAFTGAYGVFSVQQPWASDYKSVDCEGEIRQGKNVAAAAKETGVKHVVYTSAIGAGREATGVPHVDSKTAVEKALVALGVPHTILRPATFFDNWSGLVGDMALKPGKLPGICTTEAPVYYISAADIGKFAAAAFENPNQYLAFAETAWQAIDIAGDCKSGEELAKSLERVFGYPFSYSAPPLFLMKFFVPEFGVMREWSARLLDSPRERF
eukprot:tig00020746_g13652.t1